MLEPLQPQRSVLPSETKVVSIAQTLVGPSLPEEARHSVMSWARDLATRQGVNAKAITPIEHLLVARTLKEYAASFNADERDALGAIYRTSYESLVGRAPRDEMIRPLPRYAKALDDRRVRLLQGAIFDQPMLASYRPTLADAAIVGGVAALALVSPTVACLMAGLGIASAVEHQIHVHVMHANPKIHKLFATRKDPLSKLCSDFYFIHEGIHHKWTFLDDVLTKWRPGDERRLEADTRQSSRAPSIRPRCRRGFATRVERDKKYGVDRLARCLSGGIACGPGRSSRDRARAADGADAAVPTFFPPFLAHDAR